MKAKMEIEPIYSPLTPELACWLLKMSKFDDLQILKMAAEVLLAFFKAETSIADLNIKLAKVAPKPHLI